jgi:hypothetical protein
LTWRYDLFCAAFARVSQRLNFGLFKLQAPSLTRIRTAEPS